MSDSPLPFATLGHYAVLRRLGQGGMGDVYLGYEPALERNVAIKVFPESLMRETELLQRFRSESIATAKLSHPNIVPIYFVGEDGGRHYFVMRFVAGESLAERLTSTGRLPEAEVLRIGVELASALAAAHDSGLVHRDVKPANILLDQADSPVLIDFGLVKSLDRSRTATGLVMGTPDYLSPEQAVGAEVGPASDRYSLGAVLYEMAAGRLPYDAHSASAMVVQHAQGDPKPLSEVSDVSQALASVVMRLLDKDPQRRFATTGELHDALRGLLQKSVGGPRAIAGSEDAKRTAMHKRLMRDGIGWFQRQAPEFSERVLNTELQFDGAIATLEMRNQDLIQLRDEARRHIGHLEASASESAEAAREHEAAKQNIASLDSLVEDNNRKIAAFRRQRDLINKRLQQAQPTAPAGKPPAQRWALAAVLALIIIAAAIPFIGGSGRSRHRGRRAALVDGDTSPVVQAEAAFEPQDDFDLYTRATKPLERAPNSLRGRFRVAHAWGGKVEIELFHNGSELPLSQGVSPSIGLNADDVIAVRHYSEFSYRAFRIVFLSDDGSAMWPLHHDDLKELAGDISAFDSDFVRNAGATHPTRVAVTWGPNGVEGRVRGYYAAMYLPANDSEWLDGSRNQWRQFAGVFEPSKLLAAPPRDRPVLRLTRAAHKQPIRAFAFSGPGAHLATTDGRTTRLWDTESGELVKVYRSTTDIAALAFSENGKTLGGVTPRGEVARFNAPAVPVVASTANWNAKLVAVPNGMLKYYVVEEISEEELGESNVHSLRSVEFGTGATIYQRFLTGRPKSLHHANNSGTLLLTYEKALGVVIYDRPSEIVLPFPAGVTAAASSSRSGFYAVATNDNAFQLVTLEQNARPYVRIVGLKEPAKFVALATMTDQAAFYSNGNVSFVGITSKKVLPYAIPVDRPLVAMHFNSVGSVLMLAFQDGTFELWDVPGKYGVTL